MVQFGNIPQLTRSIITLVDENETFDDRDWGIVDSFAGTYRIYCERSAKIVLDDLNGYPNVPAIIEIQQAQAALDIDPYQCRDTLRHYMNWAYRYGAKRADEVTYPDDEYRGEAQTTLHLHAEDLIESGEATVNDMALAFKLAYEYHNERQLNTSGEQADSLLEFYDRVHGQVVELVARKEPDLNWDLLGGWFNSGRRMANEEAHEQLGRRKGRREIIEELRATELSLDEWLAENTD